MSTMTAAPTSISSPPASAAAGSGWFLPLAGGLLAFCGVASLLAAFGNSELLQVNDPVFNLPTRWVLLAFGLLELAIALLCLFSRRRNLCLGLLLWLPLTLGIYRVGAGMNGWQHPYSYLGQFMHSLNLSPLRADGMMTALLAFWFGGSLVTLWRARRRDQAERFFKMSCPACGRHIRFAAANLGQQLPCPQCRAAVTLRPPGAMLKMNCFFCQGHIEFPAHALGEKMPCPHCKMDITLKEPA